MKHTVTLTSALALAVGLGIGWPAARADTATVGITAAEIGGEVTGFGGAEAFWTRERIRSARPLPFYDAESDPGSAFTFPEAGPEGAPTVVPGGLPGDRPEPPVEVHDTGSSPKHKDFGADFGTQNVFDDSFVNKKNTLRKQFPWQAIGKLLFTGPTGGSGWCSASVISPNNVIVTAAHCCYDRSAGWMSNWSFAPAMKNTNATYGLFPWKSARVLSGWIQGGGRAYDVCVLTMGPRADGKELNQVVGWLGLSWNFGTTQHHRAFGYPSNIDSGKFKYECAAESYANCGDLNVLAQGCSMTFGSSGGPWIRGFRMFEAGAANYVNGVVSGWDGCTGSFGQSFNAARFTSANIVPLCNDEGC